MNILLVTMALDIGGAETHVVSLAKSLKKKGHTPIVVSAGGVYVKELEENNIKHYIAPLDRKGLKSILESVKTYKDIIKRYNIDIIHAHGRIPAFVGKIVSIMMNIPFMTTAHARFKDTFVYKYMSFWGEKVICISDDVKEHLVKNFGVKEKKITVITNGIDIDRFIPGLDTSKIIKELGLNKDIRRVVYVSRITGPLAELAKLVVEAGKEINLKKNNIEFVIVGDGEDFNEIDAMSKEANLELGKKMIHVLGKRTDIPEIMSIADVVISVSRTALEAMACEKPVILAGGEGYMGLLTEDKIDAAISNNFTGRTVTNKVTKKDLENEILSTLNPDKEERRRELGEFGRKIVTDYFSIDSMTNKTIEVYKKLIRGRKNK